MANVSVSDMLAEAQAAYHDLLIGKSIARARDSNGEEVTYTQADRGALSAYIDSLKRQIANPCADHPIGPMRFSF